MRGACNSISKQIVDDRELGLTVVVAARASRLRSNIAIVDLNRPPA